MKKKPVAICLSGAVAKVGERFLTQGSLYDKGEYININVCHNSTIKHIVNSNPNYVFDFFIHSWNEDLETNLVSLYQPKKYQFENNLNYNAEINSKIKEPTDFAGASKALSMCKSLRLMESYAKEDDIKYDLVIIYRPDIILFKDINLANYDNSKIHVNSFLDGQGDFHFIMNYDYALEFKRLYNSLDQGNAVKTHFWIKNFINKFMNQPLYNDDVIAGEDQEVIRKIYTRVNANINIDTLLKYGLTEQEHLKYSK